MGRKQTRRLDALDEFSVYVENPDDLWVAGGVTGSGRRETGGKRWHQKFARGRSGMRRTSRSGVAVVPSGESIEVSGG